MAQLASWWLMSGFLVFDPLPGSLGPQTPQKNRATGLQSSDFGWNFQSKHHYHFIGSLVGPLDDLCPVFLCMEPCLEGLDSKPPKKTGPLASKVLILDEIKIRTLEAGGPVFSGGLGSKTSRQGSIHQNTQHKMSGGKSIFSKLMECEALLRNFIRLILEGKETIKRSFGMQRRDFVQNF